MNRIPSRDQVEHLRQRYPAGTRIVLQSMDDAQAPPPGTMGTVVYVDDMGQLGVEWDNGSALSLRFFFQGLRTGKGKTETLP